MAEPPSSSAEFHSITSHRSEWLEALRKANCLKLKDLLNREQGLIMVYLAEEGWDERYQCTALHVAVKAGCGELVDIILDLFKHGFSHETRAEVMTAGSILELQTNSEAELNDGERLTSRKLAEWERLKRLLHAIDGYSRLNALSIAMVNRNPLVIRNLLRAYSRFGFPTFGYLSAKASGGDYGRLDSHDSTQYEDLGETDIVCFNLWSALRAVKFCTFSNKAFPPSDSHIETEHTPVNADVHHFRAELRRVIRGAVGEMDVYGRALIESFEGDSKLNFLPWEEYMYHHIVGKSSDLIHHTTPATYFMDLLKEKLFKRPELARHLLKLRDGSGRTPISSAVEEKVEDVLSMIPAGPDSEECLNATDFAGRTLLHRAAAYGPESCLRLLAKDYRTNLNAVVSGPKKYKDADENNRYDIDMDALSVEHNYSTHGYCQFRATPLYLAIIHSKDSHVKHLLHADLHFRRQPDYRLDLNQRCVCDAEYDAAFTSLGSRKASVPINKRLWTPLQLAALMGQERVLMLLAHDDRAYDPGRLSNSCRAPSWKGYQSYTACQLAAASGSSAALRVLLDSGKFDPLVKDKEGNSVLHYAVCESTAVVNKHLMDIVWCNHNREALVQSSQAEGSVQVDKQTKELQRQHAVKMLLRAGMDIWNFKENKRGQIADPGSEASMFMRAWWQSLLDQAILEAKNSMKTAANAISVTAALVATASYVGPMQPPLGYSQDRMYGRLHTEVLAVRFFVVCDTLAFYLAVAGIMFAVIPSFLLPQEPVMDELRRIKRSLASSIILLITSIVSVLGAFAAASIAVISDEGAWNQGGLTLYTAVIGMLVCMTAVYIWCLLMMRLLLYKNGCARRLYRRFSFLVRFQDI